MQVTYASRIGVLVGVGLLRNAPSRRGRGARGAHEHLPHQGGELRRLQVCARRRLGQTRCGMVHNVASTAPTVRGCAQRTRLWRQSTDQRRRHLHCGVGIIGGRKRKLLRPRNRGYGGESTPDKRLHGVLARRRRCLCGALSVLPHGLTLIVRHVPET